MSYVMDLIGAILPSLIVGLFLRRWDISHKKREAEIAQKEARRQEGELRELDLLVATAELTYAVAICLRDGKNNGEMKAGIEHYDAAMDKFRKYERKTLAET